MSQVIFSLLLGLLQLFVSKAMKGFVTYFLNIANMMSCHLKIPVQW